MQTRIQTVTGDRCLVKTVFEADPADPDTYQIEVIYEVHRPAIDDFTIEGDPYFMDHQSTTRTDTRQPVNLSPEKLSKVKQAVISKLAESKMWGTG